MAFQAYVSLTEERVISQLLRSRVKMDRLIEDGSISSELLDTYVDLDRLISGTKLSVEETFTLRRVMEGYTFWDMEMVFGKSHKTYEGIFKRVCRKLKETNDRHWRKKKKFYAKGSI